MSGLGFACPPALEAIWSLSVLISLNTIAAPRWGAADAAAAPV